MSRIATAADSRLALRLSAVYGQRSPSRRDHVQAHRRDVAISPCCTADIETMRTGFGYCGRCYREYLVEGWRAIESVDRGPQG